MEVICYVKNVNIFAKHVCRLRINAHLVKMWIKILDKIELVLILAAPAYQDTGTMDQTINA